MINMTIRVREIDMKRHIAAKARERRLAVAQQAAREMHQEVIRIIEAEFHNDRPDHRRKGTMKLINSFETAVIERPNTVDAILRPKAGADEKKIAALNFGWDGFIQDAEEGFAFPDPRTKGNNNVYGNNSFFTWGPIENRGREGVFFLRKAKQRVARRLRKR